MDGLARGADQPTLPWAPPGILITAGPRFSSAARRATISGRHTSGMAKFWAVRMIRGELGGLNLLALTETYKHIRGPACTSQTFSRWRQAARGTLVLKSGE
jgi:hypothetical protein